MKVNRIELPETLTEKTALQFVGNIASVCVGKFNQFDADRCEKIGRKNLTESLGKPTRAWEFLPSIGIPGIHYNNFRELMTKEENMLYYCIKWFNNFTKDEYSDFHIFHLRIPRMVRDHIKTHTTLSSLCESTRLGDPNKEVEYFFPEVEIDSYSIPNTYEYMEFEEEEQDLLCNQAYTFYNNFTHKSFRDMMKRHYTRKEIWSRPLSDFVMGDMIIAGYRDSWQHFINVRTDKATQKETRWVAEQIKKLITT